MGLFPMNAGGGGTTISSIADFRYGYNTTFSMNCSIGDLFLLVCEGNTLPTVTNGTLLSSKSNVTSGFAGISGLYEATSTTFSVALGSGVRGGLAKLA